MKHYCHYPILFLFLLIFFQTCAPKKEKPDTTEIEYSAEVREAISYITSGQILPSASITVIFVDNIVSEEELEKEVKNPFSFSPSINGTARWVGRDQLVFEPDEPIPSRINYTGKIDLTTVSTTLENMQVDMKFYVEGLDLVSFDAELELANPADPNALVYRGKLVFSHGVNEEMVQNATSFESITVNWYQETDRVLTFVSDPILRPAETKSYRFSLNASDLDLLESLERNVTIMPLDEFELSGVEKDEQGKQPKIMLKFSDNLDEKQDLQGFVSVNPDVEFDVQKLGSYLMLDGNFKFGTEYTITVQEGVKSKWGSQLPKAVKQQIAFSDIRPQVQFGSNGIFMPTSNNKQLQFLTANLARVHVEIKKVLNKNTNDFFEYNETSSSKNRNSDFSQDYVSTLGAIVYNQTLEIEGEKNRWYVHNLALDNVLEEFSNGIFLVRINFNFNDVLTPVNENKLSFIQKHGQVYKALTISDIGILAKSHGNRKLDVYTTDLRTGKPMPGVKVSTISYNDVNSQTTNAEGMATLYFRSYYSLIRAEKNGQFTFLKPYEMAWSTSGFSVGGISADDLRTRAYTYTERGVYRPGDSVNLSCIVRYNPLKTSDRVPAYFKLFNPQGTMVHEQIQKGAKDGFYNFTFGTNQNAPTGNWQVQIIVGNKFFYHPLKIETVVANRLKVNITPAIRTILPEHNQLDLTLESKYLFGATADGLPYEADIEVFDLSNPFPQHNDYDFTNQLVAFQYIREKIAEGKLDAEGKASIVWQIPKLQQAPSPLRVRITGTVQEEGGRPNDAMTFVNLNPFTHYVGIKKDMSYVKLNSKSDIPVVVVDHTGKIAGGRELEYRIYKNDSYWWYQYNSFYDFKMRFKTDTHSYLIESGTISSAAPYALIPFLPAQSGQYLIEVQDAQSKGHIASVFASAYPYGAVPSGDLNAGMLSLRSEKSSYKVGDEAIITFPSPRQGNVLMTVERANQILISKWVASNPEKEDMNIRLRISEAMTPNIYVTITALQEHAQTVNDRPIRMFGILPLRVIDPNTVQELAIQMPDKLKPKEKFAVEVNTLNGRPTQFTIAVVDEGLLDLTNFSTPDPWQEFFRKLRLGVETYDMFAHVIGANEQDVFKTFSIGGDGDYRESQLDPFEKKKRFKPICMFKGPLMTDSRGKAKVSFEMPNYVGSVRVMVVSAQGNAYGSAEKTVPVTSDLIVQATLPRALKPGDEFEIPANVFATKEDIGEVDVKIDAEGPLEVIGQSAYQHTFATVEDQMFTFKVRVLPAIGQSKITVTASAASSSSEYEADIAVMPSAARVYVQDEKVIKPGETISFSLPKLGMDGTNNARIQIATFPNMDFMHRLEFLIRYPYGCIEQTTSSVFPQLALKTLLSDDESSQRKIDMNINAGIDRLRRFQVSEGGFSYWPGGMEANPWGTNYAAQFLFEARKQGYMVPDAMYDAVANYLVRESRISATDEEKHLMTRVNRCYVLALADKAPMSEMNLLRQNHFEEMSNVEKWQLITAFQLSGANSIVNEMMTDLTTEVQEYRELGNTYGSRYRDLGIILSCLVLMERDEDAAILAKNVAKTLSDRNWYSTQTTGQMLLGIARYFDYAGIFASQDIIIEGNLTLPNGEIELIKSVDKFAYYINEGYGETLQVSLDSSVPVKELYATLASNGVPLEDQSEEENKNITLNIDWYDEDGQVMDVRQVKQGESFYGRFKVTNSSVLPQIDEVALVQLLPSGWEIENTRLSGELLPTWMKRWNTGYEDYVDIRDDRIMWFFDVHYDMPLEFVVKVNAITKGTFELPGMRCEAMYDNSFLATKQSIKVKVIE
jgi:uncharacterized protein YfaS (alpha-2-macroglobulin family)